jgi:hypothetical protein
MAAWLRIANAPGRRRAAARARLAILLVITFVSPCSMRRS